MKLNKNDMNKISGIVLFIVLMSLLIIKIIFKNPF